MKTKNTEPDLNDFQNYYLLLDAARMPIPTWLLRVIALEDWYKTIQKQIQQHGNSNETKN